MSKFFDEMSKGRLARPQAEVSQAAGVQQILEASRGLTVPGGDLGSARLANCAKARLPRSPRLLLLDGNEGQQAGVESYRTLRTRLMRLKATQGLRSVVISSATHGEGKTLTALNLAMCCAQLPGLRVLLIDGDLRTRGMTRLLEFPVSPGLAEILGGRVKPEKAIISTHLQNLYVLSAGSAAAGPSELYSGRAWQDFIGWCSETFKLVLVDSPPILPVTDAELITAACDGVLVVVRARCTRRELLQKAVGHLDARKVIGVVHNAVIDGYHSGYESHYYSESERRK